MHHKPIVKLTMGFVCLKDLKDFKDLKDIKDLKGMRTCHGMSLQ